MQGYSANLSQPQQAESSNTSHDSPHVRDREAERTDSLQRWPASHGGSLSQTTLSWGRCEVLAGLETLALASVEKEQSAWTHCVTQPLTTPHNTTPHHTISPILAASEARVSDNYLTQLLTAVIFAFF